MQEYKRKSCDVILEISESICENADDNLNKITDCTSNLLSFEKSKRTSCSN